MEAAGPAEDAVMSLLFADAVGFSQLTDAEVPLFVDSCLGLVARLIERGPGVVAGARNLGRRPVPGVHRRARRRRLRLDLLEAMAATDWRAAGFSRPLTMRFALHAGRCT
jgi:hypothetical protein